MITTKQLGTVTGVFMTLFAIVIGALIIFKVYGPVNDIRSLSIFASIEFAYVLILLVVIYLINLKGVKGLLEHLSIIFAILMLAGSVGFASAQMKMMPQVDESEHTYYQQYVDALKLKEEVINSQNKILEQNLIDLSAKLDERKPIIHETIIELPPQIIYEEVSEDYETYDDDSREYEEEDD